MNRQTISEIRSIMNIYNRILENKKIIFEQDIFGIDELVHNPVTGFGGELGYGYDRGRRVPGITWPGHGGHLHVGFTDKNTAMAVMDKAQSLGLRTAENPYAMTHYVNPELHTRGPKPGVEDDSFHHQRFEGSPEVGKGVDITGSHQKLVELILWIEQTYSGNYVPPTTEPETGTQQNQQNQQNQTSDNLATAGVLGGAALATYGIKKVSDFFSSNKGNQQSSSVTTSTDSKSDYFKGKAEKKKYGGENEFIF